MRLFLFSQFVCVMIALFLVLQPNLLLKIVAGVLVLAVGIWFSYRLLRQEITLFSDFKAKLKQKFSRRQMRFVPL